MRLHFRRPRAASLALLAACLSPAALEAQGPTANFSAAVAAAGDQVLIGQPMNRYDPGSVYVYRLAGPGNWRRLARLRATDSAVGDGFGAALAVHRGTLLVGAPAADSGRGAVYVFTRSAEGTWRQTARITPPERATAGRFGLSVAVAGDVALVGAAGTDSVGIVWAFRRAGEGWAADGRLSADGAAPRDRFGQALALLGDDAFVGAAGRDSASGAVYRFRRAAPGRWTAEGPVRTGRPQAGMRVGTSLVAGPGRVYVGAPGALGNTGAAAALEYDSTAKAWMPRELFLPFGVVSARAGSALALDGPALWAAAPGAAGFRGRIFRYEADSSGRWRAEQIAGPAGGETQGFGHTLAVAESVAVAGLVTASGYGDGAAALMSRGRSGWRVDQVVQGEAPGLAGVTGKEVRCADGAAGRFGCANVDLLAFLPIADLGGNRSVLVNDVWGWTDPESGREYALVGRSNGTAFVDVTDPAKPRFLGSLPMTEGANAAVWRDIKVYRDHAFIVADGSGPHGMQVFDLTRLRDVTSPRTFTADARYARINSAHNVVVDTASGFAFAVGASSGGETCGGALHMIDIREPKAPTFAGCFADPGTGYAKSGYTHDAQCVVYHGPDARYTGRQVCFNSSETALGIADVTDKARPRALGHATFPNVAYAHQGWLSEDQRWFYMNDEGDEVEGKVPGTRTLIWDVSDLEDPVLAAEFIAENRASDHNLYVAGGRMYQANYRSGLRVLDLADPVHPKAIGHFDTVPVGEDDPGFEGAFSVYPFFRSGTLLVTSMKEGLFLLRAAPASLTP